MVGLSDEDVVVEMKKMVRSDSPVFPRFPVSADPRPAYLSAALSSDCIHQARGSRKGTRDQSQGR